MKKHRVTMVFPVQWLAGFLVVLMGVAASGCVPASVDETFEEPVAKPTQLLQLIDAWTGRGGTEPAFSRITIWNSDRHSVAFKADTNISVERYWELRPEIAGVARKDTGTIVKLSVRGNAHGPAVTAEKIEFLIPYLKVAVGIMDPSLSNEECDKILEELGVSMDNLDYLEEVRRNPDLMPKLVQNGIEYRLDFPGSEEGATVRVTATLLSNE